MTPVYPVRRPTHRKRRDLVVPGGAIRLSDARFFNTRLPPLHVYDLADSDILDCISDYTIDFTDTSLAVEAFRGDPSRLFESPELAHARLFDAFRGADLLLQTPGSQFSVLR